MLSNERKKKKKTTRWKPWKRKEGRNKEWTFRKFKRWQRVRKANKRTDEFEMKRKGKKTLNWRKDLNLLPLNQSLLFRVRINNVLKISHSPTRSISAAIKREFRFWNFSLTLNEAPRQNQRKIKRWLRNICVAAEKERRQIQLKEYNFWWLRLMIESFTKGFCYKILIANGKTWTTGSRMGVRTGGKRFTSHPTPYFSRRNNSRDLIRELRRRFCGRRTEK